MSETRTGTERRVAFGPRLREAMDEFGPRCVGLDPHPQVLEAWGLPVNAQGLRRFTEICIDAFAGRVAAVKPQSAFFEEYGSAGIGVLEDTLGAFRAAGTLTILDVKRGDIGSTMAGYARAYLRDEAPLAADAITVNPYLGFGSLAPALELAAATGRGLFVLALTSNPEGACVQHAVYDRESVAAAMVAGAASANATAGESGLLGSVGLVVGATIGGAIAALGIDLARANAPILAPGIGAQGGGRQQAREVYGQALPNVLLSSSRDILAAGPDTGSLRHTAQVRFH